jgi:hypothetical protein
MLGNEFLATNLKLPNSLVSPPSLLHMGRRCLRLAGTRSWYTQVSQTLNAMLVNQHIPWAPAMGTVASVPPPEGP